MQIAQVTQKYQDAMKELANIQSPQFVRGMSEEESVSYTHLLSTHKYWTAFAYTKLKLSKHESKTL